MCRSVPCLLHFCCLRCMMRPDGFHFIHFDGNFFFSQLQAHLHPSDLACMPRPKSHGQAISESHPGGMLSRCLFSHNAQQSPPYGLPRTTALQELTNTDRTSIASPFVEDPSTSKFSLTMEPLLFEQEQEKTQLRGILRVLFIRRRPFHTLFRPTIDKPPKFE
ncbi:unnamed protein product [Periconia digitata]|uniref:Uncharacterized protein n=1 Tax=Periconia digitata TaxID=1303443 RepID=A0A9W4XUW1_9PLEO|nr:unnamed protein product [Periconia digitata]